MTGNMHYLTKLFSSNVHLWLVYHICW